MSTCRKHGWPERGGTYADPTPPCPWCQMGDLRKRIAELEAELARETSAYRAVTDSNVDLGQRILLLEAEKLFFKRQASEALADNDKLRGWIKAVYVEGWNDSKGSFEHDFAEYWDASDAKELLGGGG